MTPLRHGIPGKKGKNGTNRYHRTLPVEYMIDSIHLELQMFMKSYD